MSDFFADNLIWIILYPLWIFGLICTGRFFAVKMSKKIITGLTLLGSALGIIFSAGALPHIFNGAYSEFLFTFIKIQKFLLQIGVCIDRLSIICLLLLFIISFFIQFYSMSYMNKEEKYYRFFAYLNLFNFGMAALFTSPNLFQTYMCWELVGVVSYLLIGFRYDNIIKSVSAIKAFLINRIGDTAFFAGIICIIYIMASYSVPQFVTLDYSDFNIISSITYVHTNEVTFSVLCLLLFAGSIAKSAQFPLHSWLLSAMEAATPVSALIHSATMVAAGVFLTIRLLPLFSLSSDVMYIIAYLGMFTALFCSLCAICQTNVKSTLAYSTSSNLGLMFAAIGFGNIDLALIYLIIHGFIKAALFLSYGYTNNEYNKNKETTLPPFFIIGSFALSGLAFAGLNAKELFFETFKTNMTFTIAFLLVSFMCAVYIFRLCCKYPLNNVKLKNWCELVPIWSFLLIIITGTIFIRGSWLGVPFFIAFTGALTTIVLTLKTNNSNAGIVTKIVSNGFYIDYIYSKIIFCIYKLITVAANKIDLFISGNKIILGILHILINIAGWVEKNIFEFPIKFTVFCLRFASREFDTAQTKNVQTYIAYSALVLGIVFTSILLTYSFVLNHLGGIG